MRTLRKFTPEGQELILGRMKNYRNFYQSQGKTMQSFRLWDSPALISFGLQNELKDQSRSIRDLLQDLIKEVKSTSVSKGKGNAFNKVTGVQEKIYIDEFSVFELFRPNGEPSIIHARDAAGKIIGKMQVGNPGNGALKIHDIATSDEYNGIGRELIRKVVEQSKRLNLHGKVQLTAWTGYLPEDYCKLAGTKTKDVAAAIKYHKMGFKAIEPELEEEIAQTINKGGTGLSPDGIRDYLVGDMELTESAIKEFLA